MSNPNDNPAVAPVQGGLVTYLMLDGATGDNTDRAANADPIG